MQYEYLIGGIWDAHVETANKTRTIIPSVSEVAHQIVSILKGGNKILMCGNGGSAADCQHIATEFTIRFERERIALPALALTTDTSALTAAANDFGIDEMFARQVNALGMRGDMLIGLTTSGNSRNVINAFEAAKSKGLFTVCLTGNGGGNAIHVVDKCIVVPSTSTARIQEMHILIGHVICSLVDKEFNGA